MATNRFLVVAKYAVGSNKGLKDVDLVDTRVRGGGIKDDLIETFKGAYPQVRWFHDIGHYDGTPFPGATAVLVDLPASLLESNGGVLTKKQIDSIVKHHLSFGVYPVIRFYCTNTGLFKHETVEDSAGLGQWIVPDGETCPAADGEVICTYETFTTTTTTTTAAGGLGDHFDDAVLGSEWTLNLQGNGTAEEPPGTELVITTPSSGIYNYLTTDASQINGIRSTDLLSGDFDKTAILSGKSNESTNHSVAFVARVSNDTYVWIDAYGNDTVRGHHYFPGTTGAGQDAWNGVYPLYFRIARVSGTFYTYWSQNGTDWTELIPDGLGRLVNSSDVGIYFEGKAFFASYTSSWDWYGNTTDIP